MNGTSQPWLRSPSFDGALILAPGLIATLVVLFLAPTWSAGSEVSLFGWLLLVVAIDVAHVYSTIYRTYLDSDEWQSHRTLLTVTPFAALIVAVLVYAVSPVAFWRGMAYLAVFHFVRQQYGFVMLYKRQETLEPRWQRRLDQGVIYLATLYPLVYWHTHPRQFEWFIAGDFFHLDAPWLATMMAVLYVFTLAAYLGKELWLFASTRRINLPKNLVVAATAASWYVGIVAFNGDLAFTITNVVTHGVPYTALIWAYGRRRDEQRRVPVRRIFRLAYLPAFLGLLMVLAYVEEGLWDALVWADHAAAFPWASALPQLTGREALSFVVPLLAVPQLTHYVVDGFIWKLRGRRVDL